MSFLWSGLISCIMPSHIQTKVLAAGSYLGTVGLYSQDDGKMIALMEAHCGGVTQVRYMCTIVMCCVTLPLQMFVSKDPCGILVKKSILLLYQWGIAFMC